MDTTEPGESVISTDACAGVRAALWTGDPKGAVNDDRSRHSRRTGARADEHVPGAGGGRPAGQAGTAAAPGREGEAARRVGAADQAGPPRGRRAARGRLCRRIGPPRPRGARRAGPRPRGRRGHRPVPQGPRRPAHGRDRRHRHRRLAEPWPGHRTAGPAGRTGPPGGHRPLHRRGLGRQRGHGRAAAELRRRRGATRVRHARVRDGARWRAGSPGASARRRTRPAEGVRGWLRRPAWRGRPRRRCAGRPVRLRSGRARRCGARRRRRSRPRRPGRRRRCRTRRPPRRRPA